MSVPDRIRWAVPLLDLPPGARVLEIGCGPGHAVALLCDRSLAVTAIDRSATAVARACTRNAAHVAAGHARIERAALEDDGIAASLGAPFDAALAVNVNVFWTRPVPAFAAAGQLLRPGTRLYLVYEPPTARRREALGAEIAALCETHGLTAEATRLQPEGRAVCVVARSGRAP